MTNYCHRSRQYHLDCHALFTILHSDTLQPKQQGWLATAVTMHHAALWQRLAHAADHVHSMAWHGTAWHGTAQHSMTQHSITWHSIACRGMAQLSIAPSFTSP